MSETAVERDVVYGDAGDRSLRLDIYRPQGRSLRTAVVMAHGGGWSRGSKDMLVEHAKALAAEGFVAVPIEYRLTGEAHWPAQIHDLKRAIRWVRSHADAAGVRLGPALPRRPLGRRAHGAAGGRHSERRAARSAGR